MSRSRRTPLQDGVSGAVGIVEAVIQEIMRLLPEGRNDI